MEANRGLERVLGLLAGGTDIRDAAVGALDGRTTMSASPVTPDSDLGRG